MGIAVDQVYLPSSLSENSPADVQTHTDIAPFLSIYSPTGQQLFRYKAEDSEATKGWGGLRPESVREPRRAMKPSWEGTFYQGYFKIPEDALVGEYTASLELGAGPDLVMKKEESFKVVAAPDVILDPMPTHTNAPAVSVSGKSVPGASIIVRYSYDGKTTELEAVIADSNGIFSIDNIPLAEEGSYSFTAIAMLKDLIGEASLPQTIVIDRRAPGMPVDLRGEAQDQNRILLTWAAPIDEDLAGYRIFRNGEKIGELGEDALQFLDGGLQGDTEYSYEVLAVDKAGNLSPLTSVKVKTLATGGVEPPPRPPSGSEGKGTSPVTAKDEEQYVVGPEASTITAFGGELILEIPEAAFEKESLITLRRDDAKAQEGLAIFSPAYEIDAGEIRPEKPLTLKIKYDARKTQLLDLRKLAIYSQVDKGHWVYLGGLINANKGLVSKKIHDFFAYVVAADTKTFIDLQGHWSERDVEVLISREIVKGVDDRHFEPDRNITRAEMTKLLVEVLEPGLGRCPQSKVASTSSFKDVNPTAWYHPYVEIAAKYGIVKGSNGYFRPDDPVTREEMAVMILRTPGLDADANSSGGLSYSDAGEVSDWALSAVSKVTELGLMQGVLENSFWPRAHATRAQAAVVVMRVMEKIGLIVEIDGPRPKLPGGCIK